MMWPGYSTTALAFKGITKRFGELLANDQISFQLGRGEILALLGENGAGKTTLMNVLFGHYQADEGEIEIDGQRLAGGSTDAAIRAGVGMVHQHFVLADNLTVLENIILGSERLWSWRHDCRTARARLQSLADRFGLKVEARAKVRDLSVGERQRVEILKALYRDSRVLILDEPTAVLTPAETTQLFATLRALVSDGLSVIFISHKLHEILAISHRVAVLRQGKLVGLVETARTDRHQLAAMMVGRSVSRPTPKPLTTGPEILRVQKLGLLGKDGQHLLEEIDLSIRAHEIVGIAGVAGNGQTALADVLSGLNQDWTGTVDLHAQTIRGKAPRDLVRLGVGRIPEDRQAQGLIGEMAIWENLGSEKIHERPLSNMGMINRARAIRHANGLISDFDIRCNGPTSETRLLSGGNMQKLVLARVLAEAPDFILANQPVRGLDEGAIVYVQHQLLQARGRGAAILLISEDLDELMAIADRIAVIYRGHLSEALPTSARTVTEIGLLMSTAHSRKKTGSIGATLAD